MGDRCYLELIYLKKDSERVANIFGKFGNEIPISRTLVKQEIDQANYGLYEEQVMLAKHGVCFFGFHSEGGEYDAGYFVGFKGKHYHYPINKNGRFVVEVDEKGFPIANQLKDVRAIIRIERKVKRILRYKTK